MVPDPRAWLTGKGESAAGARPSQFLPPSVYSSESYHPLLRGLGQTHTLPGFLCPHPESGVDDTIYPVKPSFG